MNDGSKIIYLAYRSPHIEPEAQGFIHACSRCRNKTFKLVEDRPDAFPMLICAVCDTKIGRMGWAHDDDPLLKPVDPEPKA